MSHDTKQKIPAWDGRAASFLAYTEEVDWFVSSLASDKRKYAIGRLVPELAASVRALVRKWKPQQFEHADGVTRFLELLSKSPVVRQSAPDAK
jgi:hypothetical protein